MAVGTRGLLISFDGLDSSGKATQVARFIQRLEEQGVTVSQFETPDYTTPSGQELRARLQNKLGVWAETPWQDKMSYFAANRAEHKTEVLKALERGEVVVYDRYVPSSLTFITIEALSPHDIGRRRDDIYKVVREEEYTKHGMPPEDISIFLDVPPNVALDLLESRRWQLPEDDEYTDHLQVQERLYAEYVYLTQRDPKRYVRIECVRDGRLLSIDEVANLVWQAILQRFPTLTS